MFDCLCLLLFEWRVTLEINSPLQWWRYLQNCTRLDACQFQWASQSVSLCFLSMSPCLLTSNVQWRSLGVFLTQLLRGKITKPKSNLKNEPNTNANPKAKKKCSINVIIDNYCPHDYYCYKNENYYYHYNSGPSCSKDG